MNAKLTLSRVMKAVEADNNSGFCINCGAKVTGVEPDARNYTCGKCHEPKIFGAEEILMMVSA